MPISWGTSERATDGRMSDLHQYAKWFNAVGYDFSLKNVNSRWQCVAWSRGDVELSYRGEEMQEPVEALHDCYSKMRDLGVAPK
jgi:hypothetical protein